MIEILLLALLTIFLIHYIYFISRVRIGLSSLRFALQSSTHLNVTVIVPARNEKNNIGRCLQSLMQQTYPSRKYSVIVVDDDSTDDTASVVRSFTERYENIKLLSLSGSRKNEIGRKPLALAHGIANASGEIILTTDADCCALPRWIEIMASHFIDDVIFVAGPVAEQASSSIFSQLEHLEFLGLITTAAGLIGSGRPIICNGANIAYKKVAFMACGGFGGNDSSCDDEFLMNKMVEQKLGKVVFAPESDAIIATNSSNTILSFLRQRIRWANKRGRYEDKSILVTLVALYLFFFFFIVLTALIPQDPLLILPLGLAFLGKITIDYFALRAGARMFRQNVSKFYFSIAELFHIPYIVIAAAIGQVASMQWKGRTIQR